MKNHFASIFAQKNHQKLLDEESDSANNHTNPVLPEIQTNSEKSHQHQIIIENTPVFFPHSPYNVQVEYMKNVIQALDKKQNALLESPTGTGKTLSLLCASLAWLKKYRHEQNKQDAPRNLKIIYASRTHAQLKQVARELKKTVYQPNISMLGSRDQYCIRGDFSQIKGTILNQSCRKAIKSNQCQFYKKDQLILMAQAYSTLLNSLEEAKQFGYKNKCCPYFFERQRLEYADLIMLPYNYLLEKDFQEVVKIENSILIFDEAHNVQNTAQDGSSFFITQNFVVEAEKDLERWIDELESVPTIYDMLKAKLSQAKISTELREYRAIMITIRTFAQFLESRRNSPEIQLQQTEEKFQVSQAKDVVDFLFKNTADSENVFRLWTDSKQTNYAKGITSENISRYLAHCVTLVEIMGEHSQSSGYHFEAWTKFILNIYDLILEDELRQKQQKRVESLENPINQYKLALQVDSSNQLSLHMWCLDPSLSFNRLLKKDIYSIILTSGTLAPFQSWACELRMDFPICLQNKHMIDITQNLRVFQNKSLDFSFQQRNNEEQINKFGISLLNLCRVIPNGILVIFSSYSLMNKLRSKWTYSKILLRIQEIKACLWEPNQTAEMQNVFELYKQKANKGAIMFAVQRGKVAEGIDFSDELCRAVFLIGVPYPPKTDQRLIQKMTYLDQVYSDPEFIQQQRLKSQEWYTQQAIRATNQALGRVIRHVNDYGIVFLCDKRFEYGDISRGLSEWVKPAIEPWLNDDDILKKTKEFFKRDDIRLPQKPQVELVQEVESQNKEAQKRKPQFFGLQNKKEFEQLKQETQIRELEYTQLQQKYALQNQKQQTKEIEQPQQQQVPVVQQQAISLPRQQLDTYPQNIHLTEESIKPKKQITLKLTKNVAKTEIDMKNTVQLEQTKPETQFDFFQQQQDFFLNKQEQEGSKKKLKITLKNKK